MHDILFALPYMDSLNVLSEIETLENQKPKQILPHSCLEITAKDHQIKTLQNKVSDRELRVTAGEKYSTKDCLILENMPVKTQCFLFHTKFARF